MDLTILSTKDTSSGSVYAEAKRPRGDAVRNTKIRVENESNV